MSCAVIYFPGSMCHFAAQHISMILMEMMEKLMLPKVLRMLTCQVWHQREAYITLFQGKNTSVLAVSCWIISNYFRSDLRAAFFVKWAAYFDCNYKRASTAVISSAWLTWSWLFSSQNLWLWTVSSLLLVQRTIIVYFLSKDHDPRVSLYVKKD